MHHDHGTLRILQRLVVDDETVLQTLVLLQIVEALLLHTSAVKDVAAGDDLGGELRAFYNELAGLRLDELADLRWDGEGLGRDELDVYIVVLEELDEGVDSSAVAEVAGEGNRQTSNSSEFFTNSEQVKEGLSWVFLGSIATIDDGYRGELSSGSSTALFWVAENNSITVTAQCTDGVGKRLSLDGAGVGCGDGDGSSTKSLHSSVKGSRRASGWLVEHGHEDATFQDGQDTFSLNT